MKKKKANNIGLNIKAPSVVCTDEHCPFHGQLRIHGRMFEAVIIKTGAAKTAKIEFKRLYPLAKFERFEKRRTRLQVHNPPCINAQVGDKVSIIYCRPISKTKNFVIIEKFPQTAKLQVALDSIQGKEPNQKEPKQKEPRQKENPAELKLSEGSEK